MALQNAEGHLQRSQMQTNKAIQELTIAKKEKEELLLVVKMKEREIALHSGMPTIYDCMKYEGYLLTWGNFQRELDF